MKIKSILLPLAVILTVAFVSYYIGGSMRGKNSDQQSILSPSKEIDHLDFVEDVNLVIDGILYSEDKPAAIIKGSIVHEWDTVQGKRILHIYENEIELEQFGKIWRQQVNKPEKVVARQGYYASPTLNYENEKQDNQKRIYFEEDYDEVSQDEDRVANNNNFRRSPLLEIDQENEYEQTSPHFRDITRITQTNPFDTSTKKGGIKFHNTSCSNGDHIFGTSTSIGQFDFHHFNSSDGTSISGTTTNIGKFGFHQLSSSDGINMSGTSTRIGNFDFHNFTTSDGRNINGTSTHVGNFTFNNFNDSAGNSINGTTTNIGNMSFSNFDR